MGWEFSEFNLDELGFLGRGKSKHRPRNDPKLYGGKYPFVQTGDVKAANLYINSFEQTYSDKGLAQSKLWEKETLVITIAANIAETAVLKIDACFPDSIVGFIPNEELVDVYFIKYYIDYIKREMQSISQGTTQDNLSLDKLRTFKLKVPNDRHIVSRVSSTLLNYDNLIENNNRRIAILEEMAQSLYREWFVNFRYPDYDDNLDADGKTKLTDSSLSQTPEGWEVKPLIELVNFKRNTIKKGCVSEKTPYMGLEHFPRKSIALSEWEEVSEIGSNKLAFNRGDILFGKIRPNFHKVGVAQIDGLSSSDTFVLSPKNKEHHALVAMVTFSNEFVAQAVQTSQGSKMPRASWDVLKEFPVYIPTQDIIEKFNSVVKPAIEQIRVLSLKNRNLKKQRDMLLPKLISGKIEL
ncbi:restriction endonuclease subunit S [Colwellia psychrerythraea]|uniref:Restriction modification system DNA specificity domain-containing protein n=1 Tax=Colwellia psychrerythraea TaxID=28229 RepID=A0A099KH40_COLPS|nr:restriction endonuclease subunit S [Colwellia psychrerythraea]KGJ89626.1 restriction modification system DNA specificity domain-containing protein [Colwellia psychrerythraea]